LSNLNSKILELERKKKLIVAEEAITMRKAMESENPETLMKAMSYYDSVNAPKQQVKSFFVDPNYNYHTDGYLSSPKGVTGNTLRAMAKSPIIKAIIETRVEEVADFLEPQPDKYSPGFVIRKKAGYFKGDDEEKVTDEDKKKIELITEFLLRGCMDESLDDICDDFNTWGRKTVKDSLILDQIGSEIIWNKANTVPMGYVAIDAATVFFADNYSKDGRFDQKSKIKVPKFVQVHNNVIVNEYFDEELMWGVRNGQTDMRYNGYGESELETLIATVTAMLQGDAYNSNIFKVGSAPAGIFRVQGNINEARLKEFQSQWRNEMAGYQNSKKTAFIEADKMEFVDLSKSNRDMEFSKFQEYLIKLACAVYKISPEEIGFSMQGEKSSLSQDSGKEKIKYSKDKGLKPLLKFLQRRINHSIIKKIDPSFEFVFVGIEMDTEEKELEMAMKKASSFKGLKEVRRERGLPDEIDKDDVILNPAWIQLQQLKQMAQMGNEESNQFVEEDDNPFTKSWHEDEDNIMAKDFKKFVSKELVNA
jgi:hypothetical protein